MKKMKLSTKIFSGFGVLVVIALVLGSIAVWNMVRVEKDAEKMAREYVPEVAIANDVERATLLAMYEIRGYGLTGEHGYLDRGRNWLEELEKHLKKASEHAEKYSSLVKLKENASSAKIKVNEYKKLVDQTVSKDNAIEREREAMGRAADTFMKNCYDFLESQNQALKKELDAGAEAAKISERVGKINLINDVIDIGNAIIVGNWKAQALRDPKALQQTMSAFLELDKKLDSLKPVVRQEANIKQLAAVKQSGEAYKKGMQDFLSHWLELQDINAKRLATAESVLSAAQTTAKAGMEDTSHMAEASTVALSRASFIMIVGLIAALAIGIGSAFFITRSITKPINRVIEGLTQASEQVASASNQVSSSSQALAEGASEQAASIEETSSSLEEMSSMTKRNADNAEQAKAKMAEAKEIVGRVNRHMEEMGKAILDIAKTSEETGKIIKTIDEIAFQTNLLALNAAVEAARAGEAGAGFAVVADEVRNLAMRAAEAAKNTSNLIENTIKSVKVGTDLTRATQDAFKENITIAGKVGELVDEIAAASSEQAQGIGQINKAVAEMDKVVQQVAANSEESASASEELNAQAEELRAFVEEMAALVGGARRNGKASHGALGEGSPQKKLVSTRPAKDKALAVQGAKHVNIGRAQEIRPQDVIPLDESEMKNF